MIDSCKFWIPNSNLRSNCGRDTLLPVLVQPGNNSTITACWNINDDRPHQSRYPPEKEASPMVVQIIGTSRRNISRYRSLPQYLVVPRNGSGVSMRLALQSGWCSINPHLAASRTLVKLPVLSLILAAPRFANAFGRPQPAHTITTKTGSSIARSHAIYPFITDRHKM